MTGKCLYNVLIFPCGSMIGLQLHKHLVYDPIFNIIGGTSIKDHGAYVYKKLISGFPFIDEEGFIKVLNQVIEDHNINFIFPTTDKVALYLSSFVERDLVRNAEVLTSPFETCDVAYSKQKTYSTLKNVVEVPRLFKRVDEIEEFPVVLKPEIGTGGRGVEFAKNRDELEYLLAIDPSKIIMEYLPGDEYTIDCFTDRKRNLRFVGGKIKSRIWEKKYYGHAERIEDNRFQELARKINKAIELNGAWFFQVKEDKQGNLKLMEFATRLGGSTSYQWMNGVNLALMALYDALGWDLYFEENDCGLELDRSLWQYRYAIDFDFVHVYLGFENTLINEYGLNHKILALIYKFRKAGKKISLIVNQPGSHFDVISESLKEHLIPEKLFDNVNFVSDGAIPPSQLAIDRSILIDSSLDRRIEIARKTKMPIFDISQAVELFLD